MPTFISQRTVTSFRMHGTLACSLIDFRECGRVMRDVALGVVGGAMLGLFGAMVGASL